MNYYTLNLLNHFYSNTYILRMQNIVVASSPEFINYDKFKSDVNQFVINNKANITKYRLVVITGTMTAKFARQYANDYKIEVSEIFPDWRNSKNKPVKNSALICSADWVIVFSQNDTETNKIIKEAKKAKKKLIIINT